MNQGTLASQTCSCFLDFLSRHRIPNVPVTDLQKGQDVAGMCSNILFSTMTEEWDKMSGEELRILNGLMQMTKTLRRWIKLLA